MSINMNTNFLKLICHFRRHDLTTFKDEHDELFEAAKTTGNHLEVTEHYYSVMSTVIDDYFGGNFHFVPPKFEGQSLDEALNSLHCHIAEKLGLSEGVSCIDVGCGIGGVIKDVAHFGARVTGITIAPNEADIGNAEFSRLKINDKNKIVAADCHKMPFADNSFDTAYAIYSLKYIPVIDDVMKEIARCLKPGGRFLVYDLIKTQKYAEANDQDKQIISRLEYACGMPSLHTRDEMEVAAQAAGLELCDYENLEETYGSPFHYCFSSSPLFMWTVTSPVIDHAIRLGETLRILPRGFEQFNRTFLCGTVQSIVIAGQKGILSGAEIFVFKKKINI